jgi:hypothetical protein
LDEQVRRRSGALASHALDAARYDRCGTGTSRTDTLWPVSTPISAVIRRIVVVAGSAITLAGLSLVLAAPAGASVPEEWDTPASVDKLGMVLLLGGVPLLLAVLITIGVYLPALARGERVAPGAPQVENQWLGGPRKSAGELAGPDSADSQAGGASGRW